MVTRGQEGHVNVAGEPAGVGENRDLGFSFDGGITSSGASYGSVSPREHGRAAADLEGAGASGGSDNGG